MNNAPSTKRLIAPAVFILGLPAAVLVGMLMNGGEPGFAVFLVVNPIVQMVLMVLHCKERPETAGWIFGLIGLALSITNLPGTLVYLWYTGLRQGWFKSNGSNWDADLGHGGFKGGSSSGSVGQSDSGGSHSGGSSGGSFDGGKSGGGGAGSSW